MKEGEEVLIDYSLVKEEYTVQEVPEQTEVPTGDSSKEDTIKFEIQEVREKTHKCPHCDKAYYRRDHLKGHLVTHTGERDYICDECHKGFPTQNRLWRHEQIHTQKKRSCYVCWKTFKTLLGLREHMVKHETIFKCEECGKKYCTKSVYEKHMKSHSDVLEFQCLKCPKKYKDRSNLRNHMKCAHTKCNAFTCEVCEKTFRWKCSLDRHMEKHSNDYRMCFYCSEVFRNKEYLRQHMKLHHSGLPCRTIDGPVWTCPMCQKKIRNLVTYDRHIKRHERKQREATSSFQSEIIKTENLKMEEESEDQEDQESLFLDEEEIPRKIKEEPEEASPEIPGKKLIKLELKDSDDR
uniref:C2H2-type domain-containing protein n=1 Tax=Lutzomyia longipalpis TaxID=7200 RepID=A0A1B0C805_LUTLO